MRRNDLLKAITMLALAAALMGCESLEFQSVPAGKTVSCDMRWVGDWQIDVSRDDGDSDPSILRISETCDSWQVAAYEESRSPAKIESIFDAEDDIQFVTIDNKQFLVSREQKSNASDPNEMKEAKNGDPEDGFVLHRFEMVDDEIHVFAGDIVAAADLVIRDRARGFVKKRDLDLNSNNKQRSDFRVVIFGDAQSTAQFLVQHPIFSKKFAHLKRASKAQSRLFNQLIKATDAKTPEAKPNAK